MVYPNQALPPHQVLVLRGLSQPASEKTPEPIYVDDLVTLTKRGLMKVRADGTTELTPKGLAYLSSVTENNAVH